LYDSPLYISSSSSSYQRKIPSLSLSPSRSAEEEAEIYIIQRAQPITHNDDSFLSFSISPRQSQFFKLLFYFLFYFIFVPLFDCEFNLIAFQFFSSSKSRTRWVKRTKQFTSALLEAGDAAVRDHALENVAWKPTRSTRHQTRRRDSDIITETHICMRLGEINNKKICLHGLAIRNSNFQHLPAEFSNRTKNCRPHNPTRRDKQIEADLNGGRVPSVDIHY
jgi:hypothetical protein